MTTTTDTTATETTINIDVTTDAGEVSQAAHTTAAADQAAAQARQAKRDARFFNLGYGLLLFGAILAMVVLGLVAFHNA